MGKPLLLTMTALNEAEGSWETIARLIRQHMLPAIEANGAQVFQTPPLSAASSEPPLNSSTRRLYTPLT